MYCLSDQASFCDACDESVHSANVVVSKHIRVPLKDVRFGLRIVNVL